MCECKVGPGKFEGEQVLTFLAYQSMLDGMADDTLGDVDFFHAPFNFEYLADDARLYGYCDACIEDALESEAYGLGIEEDSQGFVWGAEYDTKEEYEAAVARAEDASEGEDF